MALPGPVAALVGAAVSAVVIALVLAALTRSILAPLGAGAGLWMAHGVWLFGLDDALWAFAAVLALPVAVAVAAVAMAVAAVAGLLGGALDEGATPGRYGYPLTSTLRPTPRPGRGGSG